MDFFKYRSESGEPLAVRSARQCSEPVWTRRSSSPAWYTTSASSALIRADPGLMGRPGVAPYVRRGGCLGESARIMRCASIPTESVGPIPIRKSYVKKFCGDYAADPYIEEEYNRARYHKWYMTARMITVHDHLLVRPDVVVHLEYFTDSSAALQAPKEGLGWDSIPRAYVFAP